MKSSASGLWSKTLETVYPEICGDFIGEADSGRPDCGTGYDSHRGGERKIVGQEKTGIKLRNKYEITAEIIIKIGVANSRRKRYNESMRRS